MLTRWIQRTQTLAKESIEYEYRDAEYEANMRFSKLILGAVFCRHLSGFPFGSMLALAVAMFAWPAATRLAGADAAGDRPPNVVLIVADDLGWTDLACYGSDAVHQRRSLTGR